MPGKTLPFDSVYVYNRDKSILYYSTKNRQIFLRDTNIHYVTFEKHLKKGTYYLSRYLFTNYLVPTAKSKAMSLPEFAQRLVKDRKKKYNKD